jgi:transposase-like protein
MKWPSWWKVLNRKPAQRPSLSACPKCHREMTLIERTTMTGDDMRTYRCEHCQQERIVDFGTALWKVMSDARNSGNGAS